MPLRIALVAPPSLQVPPLRYGGTQRGVADLCRGLRRRGHQVTLVAPGDSTCEADELLAPLPAALWEEGSPVPEAERAAAAERYVDGALALLAARRARPGRADLAGVAPGMRAASPRPTPLGPFDVINVRYDSRRLLLGLLEPAGGPAVVYSLHNAWSGFFERFFDDPLAELVAKGRLHVTAHSQAHRRQFARLSPVQVVPYGMDVEAAPWSPEPLCPPAGRVRPWEPSLPLLRRLAGEGRNYLLHLGNIAPLKAQAAAIAIARQAGRPLVLAGAPEVRDPQAWRYHQEQVAPHVDGQEVIACGRASEGEKQELLRGALALLLTSGLDPTHPWPGESFGRPIMEALAAGTPVVAFAHASAPEVLPPGAGLLGRSPGELVDCLQRVPGLDRRHCRQSALDHFGLDRFATDVESVLERAAASRRRELEA